MQKPMTQWHSKTMLPLIKHLFRQNPLHCFFEDVAFLKPPQLKTGGDPRCQLDKLDVEHWVANTHTAQFGGARNLSQIVVGKNQLQIEIHEPVQFGSSTRRV